MSSYQNWNIEHLSPSTCNMFAESPAAFVLFKIFNKKNSVGPAAHRGTAVEAGIAKGLLEGAPLAECVREAVVTFNGLTALSADPRREKEAASLEAMVQFGLDELRPYGPPSSSQGKVEHFVEGIPVPIIGYYDFVWEKHKVVIDLKTTGQLPSKISDAHARQVALYQKCLGFEKAYITYVTPKKSATYILENGPQHLSALESIAKSITEFVSYSDDPMKLARLIAPNTGSFYFSDPIARKAVYEIWKV